MTEGEFVALLNKYLPGALYDALGTESEVYKGMKRRIKTTAHPNNEQHGGGGEHQHKVEVTLK